MAEGVAPPEEPPNDEPETNRPPKDGVAPDYDDGCLHEERSRDDWSPARCLSDFSYPRRARSFRKGGKGKGEGKGQPPALINLEGPWMDSEGSTVFVRRQNPASPSPLIATLSNETGKPKILTVRRELYYRTTTYEERWSCGNAELVVDASSRGRLLWTGKERLSVWLRPDDTEEGDAFPWLLVKNLDNTEIREKMETETMDSAEQHLLEDGGRIACLLDVRQILGANYIKQEKLSHIINDHDLVRRPEDDTMVPSASSTVWDALECRSKVDQIRDRVQRFHDNKEVENIVTFGNMEQVFVGRHQVACYPADIYTLRLRWMGPPTSQNPIALSRAAAHVLALHSVLENPLAGNRRSDLHMAIDPEIRTKLTNGFELFASPMNAAVVNGKFASKWPHVEKYFGSVGRYPDVVAIVPADATLFVHPPASDAYLGHLLNADSLAKLKAHSRRVIITAPIRDAPWRSFVAENLSAKSVFVNRFWDASACEFRDTRQPVIFCDLSL